ncbi:PCMD domain-containing protein [uncultured Porphyromonas sp.]|uniref:PCMD domain-containing protein n=3 Tax=uncultured Porphyromonas sp. TaxID=159274 RepID=UPI002621128E|nr:PCMD domain-containing protein [uncultured Porphyromonas sp.]
MNMSKSKHLLIPMISLLTLLLVGLDSCIRPEAPNAEADILSVEVEGLTPREKPLITNTAIKIEAEPWVDRSAVALSFTLTPGATISPASGSKQDFTRPVTYTVTSEDKQWTKEYTVTIASSRPAPGHFDFETVSRYKKRDTGDELFYEFTISDGLKWSSPNEGFMLSLALDPSCDPKDPSVYPVTQDQSGYRGKCAKLVTLSTGSFGAMFSKPIAPGTLFLGDFNVNEAMSNHLRTTLFGIPESRKPLMLTGYYKYKSGDKLTDKDSKEIAGKRDLPAIYAVFFETDKETPYLDGGNVLTSPNIVLTAQLKDPKESDKWIHFELPFEPVEGKSIDPAKLKDGRYKLTIVMTSSRDGANFVGAIGSTLLVDEMNLYFE